MADLFVPCVSPGLPLAVLCVEHAYLRRPVLSALPYRVLSADG